MAAIHQAASEGYTAKAEAYIRGRPEYPAAVQDWLRDDLALSAGKTVLDLGAGTGKFLPHLRATGAAVIAVEPVPAMRAQLTQRNPGIAAMAGTAEDIPLADGAADAIVCAQAFHWFANPAALAEIHRVLKSSGVLGLIWNVRDESVGWVAALTRIMAPYEAGIPRYHSGAWRRLFPAEGFGPLRERHFPNSHTGPAEQVIVDRILSVSFIAALPPAEQNAVAAEIRKVIATTPELAGKSEVAFPYETAAFSCMRK
ncbi:MAG: class I SAM-dependent methyltransferase [Dongiales bacterium]